VALTIIYAVRGPPLIQTGLQPGHTLVGSRRADHPAKARCEWEKTEWVETAHLAASVL